MTTQKFLFNRSFDDEDKKTIDPVVPPAPPVPDQAQLKVAEKKGFDEGHAKGYDLGFAEAHKTIEEQIQKQVHLLLEKMERVLKETEAIRKTYTEKAVLFTQQVFLKNFPSLEKHLGHKEIENFITSTLANCTDKKITIHAHPATIDKITPACEPLLRTNQIVFSPDPQRGFSDCEINWDHQGVERLSSHLQKELDHLFQSLVSQQEPEKECA